MIIRRIVVDADGNVDASLALTKDQAAYLINMGLAMLVTTGQAVIKDMTQQEFNEEQKTIEAAGSVAEEVIPVPQSAAINDDTVEIKDDEDPSTRH